MSSWEILNLECKLDNNLASGLKFLSVITLCSQARTCPCFWKVHVTVFRVGIIIPAISKKIPLQVGVGEK